MSVIPFPPRRGQAEDLPDETTPAPQPRGAADVTAPGCADDVPVPSDTEQLAEAMARIAMLERTLLLTARENARNRERADRAEAALDRLTRDRDNGGE